MDRIRFLSLFSAAVLTASACSGTSDRGTVKSDVPIFAVNREVKSFPASSRYSERPATVIKAPDNYKPVAPDKIVISDENIRIFLYSKEFAQGDAGYFEALPLEGRVCEVVKISFNGEDVPFTKTPWGYRGIFAIHPEAKPGKSYFSVSYTDCSGEKKVQGEVNVRDVEYPVAETILDLGKFSDKEYTSSPEFRQLIEESAEARRKAFSSESEDSISNTLSHPRDMHKVTGDYWKKRIYASYKKKGKKKVKVPGNVSYHRGLDLRGDTGAPVYSMADGRIVLARKMFYEGNMVVVDHGNKVFTYYMHMDSITVSEGDFIKAGDQVGRVGSTGTSTAPHLHVALSIRGVHVNPLSLLSLPVSR